MASIRSFTWSFFFLRVVSSICSSSLKIAFPVRVTRRLSYSWCCSSRRRYSSLCARRRSLRERASWDIGTSVIVWMMGDVSMAALRVAERGNPLEGKLARAVGEFKDELEGVLRGVGVVVPAPPQAAEPQGIVERSEEHTSELQSLR